MASDKKLVSKSLPADDGAYTAIKVKLLIFITTLRPWTLSMLRIEKLRIFPFKPSDWGFTKTATPFASLVDEEPEFVASARHGGSDLGQGTPGNRNVSLSTKISKPDYSTTPWYRHGLFLCTPIAPSFFLFFSLLFFRFRQLKWFFGAFVY